MPNASLTIDGTEVIKKENGTVSATIPNISSSSMKVGTTEIIDSNFNLKHINSLNTNSITIGTTEVLDANLNLKGITTGSIETLGLNRLNISSEYAGVMAGSGGYLFNLYDVVSDRTSGLIIVSGAENTLNRFTAVYHYGVVLWYYNSNYYGNIGLVYRHGSGNNYGEPYLYFESQASTPTTQGVSSTNKSALNLWLRSGSGLASISYNIRFVFNHNAG